VQADPVCFNITMFKFHEIFDASGKTEAGL
jgi:hypothetical protein